MEKFEFLQTCGEIDEETGEVCKAKIVKIIHIGGGYRRIDQLCKKGHRNTHTEHAKPKPDSAPPPPTAEKDKTADFTTKILADATPNFRPPDPHPKKPIKRSRKAKSRKTKPRQTLAIAS